MKKPCATDIPLARYALVTVLILLITLVSGELTYGLGMIPTGSISHTRMFLSPTPGQPPATSAPAQNGSTAANVPPRDPDTQAHPMDGVTVGLIVLPFIVVLFLLVGGVALLALIAFLFLRGKRRRLPPAPVQTPSIPCLTSSDEKLYFRLDKLSGEGQVIGRAKSGVDLKIPDSTPHADTVSEQHARVYYDLNCGNVVIEDLGSTTGIFINGRRAPRKNLLKNGWVIGLGKVNLTYQDGESDTGPLD